MRALILMIIPLLVCKASALSIVTTFPSLKEDVKLIAPNDSIYAIPAFSHDYELTPKDVEVIKNADIVISTAHTHFESEIAEMKERGEVKGVLFEIPKIKGIVFLKYPESGKINPHMPIYDPYNYEIFIRALAEELQKLNPSENYIERAEKVCKEVEDIVNKARKLNGTALVDYPYAQYAVTWMGLKVVSIAFEAPTTPETFKKVDYLVLTRNSTKSESLLENVEYSKVIYIDSPFVEKSIPEKLKSIEVKENIAKKTPGYTAVLAILALVVLCLRNGLRL
ncbi:metal ABC transporter solute-binding protein, Zn/Mn family [Archaeoglobus profundus]|nr:zinc ABC transporter substrate-binding protein [Archaeoglobus profundus]